MLERRVASRYGEALFSLARDHDIIDLVAQELSNLQQALAENRQLERLLSHPEIAVERKMTVLRNLFGDMISTPVIAFLRIIIQRQRLHLLALIEKEYRELTNRHRRIFPVQVTSAIPFTQEQLERLRPVLERLTGGKVVIDTRIDPGVLAGAMVRIGDQVIDGTARGRLTRLREALAAPGGSAPLQGGIS